MKNWRTDSKKQGSSDPFAQKEFTAGRRSQKLNIDVRDRQIDVSLSEDGQIHISYFENSKETYDISVSDDHVLTMTAAGGKDWTDFIGGKPSAENRKISLQIPDASLDTLTLSTTNEEIFGTGCDGKRSKFPTTEQKLNDVGNALQLTAKNGDISGTVAGSYDDFSIQSKIKKGDSSLPDDNGERKR